MSKIAWFLTHDDYIDRRIFFFTDVMEKQGYKVKLFPYMYFNVNSFKDFEFIKRPVKEEIIREYNVSEVSLKDNERIVLKSIIHQQEIFHDRKNTWITDVEKLKVDMLFNGIELEIDNDVLIVKINTDDYVLVYNSKTETICKLNNPSAKLAFKKCERALVEFLLKDDIENEKVYTVNDVELVQYVDGNKHTKVFFTIPGTNVLYKYDRSDKCIMESVPLSMTIEEDVINDKEFDYTTFKKIIYNYSPIINRVNEELKVEKPDVVYVADLPTLPIGIMLKETLGCKLIVDCHEWWLKQTILWEAGNEEKIKLVDEYEAEFYPQCDLCITVGQNLAQRMEASYKCSFEVIYSCMSQSLSQHAEIDRNFIQKKYNLPEDSKIAIFQGGMSTFRNLENLARATKYLEEDSYLLLLTCGDYQKEFKKILNSEGNPERVVWGGWINQDELLNYTQNVDVGVIPYTAVNDYSECFVPNKLMEYFEVQVPIFYDTSMFELDLVAGGNGVGYGANLKDVNEFGTKLNELLHNSEKLAELKTKYKDCHNKFGYDSQKNLFEKMLEDYRI